MSRLLAVTLFLFASAPVLAGDVEAGKQAFNTCLNCHGENAGGNPTLNAPNLSGQHGWYLKRHLNYYKNRIRGFENGDVYGNQMAPMALTLVTDADVDNVVAYISSLPAVKAEASIEGNAESGKAYYAVCAGCHGVNGEGNEVLNAPKLAGQHDWYLARQLKYYKTGARGSNPKDVHGATMVGMAATLPNKQAILDVVTYINTLPLEVPEAAAEEPASAE